MGASEQLNVLVVEDNTSYREGLASLIGLDPGMHCTTCANAHDALDCLERGIWHVVMMDIDLPGMDGIQCTRLIKERWPKVQVLMCTVFDDDEKIFQALKAGATGYVVKQATISELLGAVRQVHEGGSPMSPGIARKVVGTFFHPVSKHEPLTQREREILDLIAEGLTVKEIAERAHVSTNTVRTHIRNIYEKLQVRSRVEAVNRMRGT
jgi:DNA-binding NarL/FixJ family response regulator